MVNFTTLYIFILVMFCGAQIYSISQIVVEYSNVEKTETGTSTGVRGSECPVVLEGK